MPYLGSVPAVTALTSANIADGAVNSDEIATGAVDLAHLSATGTAGSGNFLRGDNSWQAAAQFANWSQSSGHLTPDNATYGIHLGVSTATAANLLDDYEEGTFTATLYFGENDNGDSSTNTYTKIGNAVRIAVQVLADSSITGTGTVQIRGLPFTNSDIGTACSFTLNDRIFLSTLKMYVTGAIIAFTDAPSSTSDTAAGATQAIFGTGAGKWLTVAAVYYV
jgi:hypothetical protein